MPALSTGNPTHLIKPVYAVLTVKGIIPLLIRHVLLTITEPSPLKC